MYRCIVGYEDKSEGQACVPIAARWEESQTAWSEGIEVRKGKGTEYAIVSHAHGKQRRCRA